MLSDQLGDLPQKDPLDQRKADTSLLYAQLSRALSYAILPTGLDSGC